MSIPSGHLCAFATGTLSVGAMLITFKPLAMLFGATPKPQTLVESPTFSVYSFDPRTRQQRVWSEVPSLLRGSQGGFVETWLETSKPRPDMPDGTYSCMGLVSPDGKLLSAVNYTRIIDGNTL